MYPIDLTPAWLRRCEVDLPGRERYFRVDHEGERFTVVVRHFPKSSLEKFTGPADEERVPSDAEVLGILAQGFLGSLPVGEEQPRTLTSAPTVGIPEGAKAVVIYEDGSRAYVNAAGRLVYEPGKPEGVEFSVQQWAEVQLLKEGKARSGEVDGTSTLLSEGGGR